MSEVVGVLVATVAATANVLSIGVNDLVITHLKTRIVAERRAERLPPETQDRAHTGRPKSRSASSGEAGRQFVSSVSSAINVSMGSRMAARFNRRVLRRHAENTGLGISALFVPPRCPARPCAVAAALISRTSRLADAGPLVSNLRLSTMAAALAGSAPMPAARSNRLAQISSRPTM